MADGLITSANAVAMLTVETLFGAPIKLENWAANRGWEPEAWEIGDSRMSLDGHHNMGYVARAIDLRLTFAPNSASLSYLDAITGASVQGQTVYRLGLELSHKDLGRKFTYVDGLIRTFTPSPAGAELLEDRVFEMRFGHMVPAGI